MLGCEPMLSRMDWVQALRENKPREGGARASCDAHSTALAVCIIPFLSVIEKTALSYLKSLRE